MTDEQNPNPEQPAELSDGDLDAVAGAGIVIEEKSPLGLSTRL